jgi:hypothetical protein
MLASAVLWDLRLGTKEGSVDARASEGEEYFCTARALGYGACGWIVNELALTTAGERSAFRVRGACAAPRVPVAQKMRGREALDDRTNTGDAAHAPLTATSTS